MKEKIIKIKPKGISNKQYSIFLLELSASGDVLIFLPGEREIRECFSFLKKKMTSDIEILKL